MPHATVHSVDFELTFMMHSKVSGVQRGSQAAADGSIKHLDDSLQSKAVEEGVRIVAVVGPTPDVVAGAADTGMVGERSFEHEGLLDGVR